MLYLAICTEGENSEPAFISELDRVLRGQSINESGVDVSVVTVPLKGVHGHTKIIEAADNTLNLDAQRATDGPLSEFSNDDSLEKWLICDYDYMEKHNVKLEDFRTDVEKAGYELVVNKPNFEFFVLTVLGGIDAANSERPSNYEAAINRAIDDMNTFNKTTKSFSEGMMVPKYSKRRHAAPVFFGKLLDYNPELIDEFCKSKFDTAAEHFSEMVKIIERMRELRNS